MSKNAQQYSGSTASVEFLVEPFVEGHPGPHVNAAVRAFQGGTIEVEVGPFASVAHGNVEQLATAISRMIVDSLAEGATALRLSVAADRAELPVRGLQDALDSMIRSAERDIGAPSDEWTRSQKQAVVRMLNERGAFLLRGAVDDIAEVMGVSRITIYNYLGAIEKSSDSRNR